MLGSDKMEKKKNVVDNTKVEETNNEGFDELTTEDEVDIEEGFANLINFKNIVDYVKTHSIDEIMKKFPCELGNDDYFYWFI